MAVLRRIHLSVGLLGLVTFAATGQYMDLRCDHLRGQPDGVRMLFRSAHIYLLLSAIANVLLGINLAPQWARWPSVFQVAGSLALLAGPPLFLLAFFNEPWLSGLNRPWARPAIYLALGGAIAHLISAAFASPNARI